MSSTFCRLANSSRVCLTNDNRGLFKANCLPIFGTVSPLYSDAFLDAFIDNVIVDVFIINIILCVFIDEICHSGCFVDHAILGVFVDNICHFWCMYSYGHH